MKQDTEQLKKEFFKLAESYVGEGGWAVVLDNEWSKAIEPDRYETIWDFFLPHLISSDEKKIEGTIKYAKHVENRKVLRLIRSHYEKDEDDFTQTVRDIADTLRSEGKNELALYALAQLGETRTFTTEGITKTTPPHDEIKREEKEERDYWVEGFKNIEKKIIEAQREAVMGFVKHCEDLLSVNDTRKFVRSGSSQSGLSLVKSAETFLTQSKEGGE